MTPEAWLMAATEAKEKLILSLVNTAHPTNFHTPFGREYEKGLITGLKAAETSHSGILNHETLEDFGGKVRATCKRIKKGEHITYIEQIVDTLNVGKVTIGEETETEKAILKEQKDAMNRVQTAWNEAVTGVQKKPIASALCKKLEKLRLSPDDKQRIYESRSWIRAGADKDGREESTDVAFYAGYKDSLDEQGKYGGPILMDLRENAEVRKKLIGALIYKRYQNDKSGNFRKACDDFCNNPVESPLGDHWADNQKSLFQNLSEKNQTAFFAAPDAKRIRYLQAR